MGLLKKLSMKDQIYELIKERILDQTYQFGDKINMMELAQELGVSNSPIREALSLLESERLVVFTPNAGPRVIDIDQIIFSEVEDTAKILLMGSYEQCLKKGLIDEVVAVMEDYLRRQEALIGSTLPGTEVEFAKLAIAFDVTLIKTLKNSTLENLYKAFFNMLFLVVLYEHQHQHHQFSRAAYVEEHRQILQAIRLGRHDEVKKLIDEHFTRS